MQIRRKREYKVWTAVVAGILVWLASIGANLALIPFERAMLTRQIVANLIGGLVTVVVCLTILLRHEESHYSVAMERAAVVAELNHQVRNAVFPLFVAVQKLGDPGAIKTADEAVDRINLALRDATTDALAGRVEYSASHADAA